MIATAQTMTATDTLLERDGRPRSAGALSATLSFAWRAMLKIKHVPEQLADVIAIPILFTLMFTYLFGGALAPSTQDYLQFLLPGTVVMSVLLVTVYTGVTLRNDIATGAFDRFRSLPVWRPAPIVGGLLGDAGRYLVAASLVIVLGVVMGFDPRGGAGGVLLAALLNIVFAVSVSWVWTTLALVLRTAQGVQAIGLVVLFPLTFASNVFVDPRTMPDWLRGAVDANPVSHLVTATRELMAGGATVGHVGWVLGASLLLTLVFAPLTMRLYARA